MEDKREGTATLVAGSELMFILDAAQIFEELNDKEKTADCWSLAGEMQGKIAEKTKDLKDQRLADYYHNESLRCLRKLN